VKFISEKTYDALFWIGVAIKGLISAGEIIAGTILCFWNYETLIKTASFFTGDELMENPRDLVWSIVTHGLNGFMNTPRPVWAFIFLSHGIIKSILIAGILKNIRWIYPASAVVFGLFALYQCYQFIYAPSALLVLITLFDVFLIALIMHEYRKKGPAAVSG